MNKHKVLLSGRPMNAPTVWFVQTIKMLRSGIFSFLLYKLSSRIGRSDTLPAVLKIYFDEIIRLVGNAYA